MPGSPRQACIASASLGKKKPATCPLQHSVCICPQGGCTAVSVSPEPLPIWSKRTRLARHISLRPSPTGNRPNKSTNNEMCKRVAHLPQGLRRNSPCTGRSTGLAGIAPQHFIKQRAQYAGMTDTAVQTGSARVPNSGLPRAKDRATLRCKTLLVLKWHSATRSRCAGAPL